MEERHLLHRPVSQCLVGIKGLTNAAIVFMMCPMTTTELQDQLTKLQERADLWLSRPCALNEHGTFLDPLSCEGFGALVERIERLKEQCESSQSSSD